MHWDALLVLPGGTWNPCDRLRVQASCRLFGALLRMALQKGCVLHWWPKGHCRALGTSAEPQGLVAGPHGLVA